MTGSISTYDLRAFRRMATFGVAALALVTLGACVRISRDRERQDRRIVNAKIGSS